MNFDAYYNAIMIRSLLPSIITLVLILVFCGVMMFVVFKMRLYILHFIADEILYVRPLICEEIPSSVS